MINHKMLIIRKYMLEFHINVFFVVVGGSFLLRIAIHSYCSFMVNKTLFKHNLLIKEFFVIYFHHLTPLPHINYEL